MKKVLLLIVLLGIVGCVTGVDPSTGQQTYGLSTGVAENIDAAGDVVDIVGPAITAGTTAINPAVGGVVGAVFGIIGSLLACWKTWRTPLIEKTDLLERVSMGARAAADVIDLAKENKELWTKGKSILNTAEKAGAINPDKL